MDKSSLAASLSAERDHSAALERALEACKAELRQQLIHSQADLTSLDQALEDKAAVEKRAYADAVEWQMKLDKAKADLAHVRGELAEALVAGERLGGAAAGMRTRLAEVDVVNEKHKMALLDALAEKDTLQKQLEISKNDIASLVEALEASRLGTEEARKREEATKREEEAATILKEREEEDQKLQAKLRSELEALREAHRKELVQAREQQAAAVVAERAVVERARELEQALVSKDGEVAEKVSAVSAALKLQFNATIRSLTEAKEAAAKESNVAALELKQEAHELKLQLNESNVAAQELKRELGAVQQQLNAALKSLDEAQEALAVHAAAAKDGSVATDALKLELAAVCEEVSSLQVCQFI